MGVRGGTNLYLQSFVDVARQQLRAHTWDEIEPALAISWEELREPETPAWKDVAAEVRRRSEPGNRVA